MFSLSFCSDLKFYIALEEREIAVVCEGVCRGSLATGEKCFLVYVHLFAVLTA
jgi:hypothetical protein